MQDSPLIELSTHYGDVYFKNGILYTILKNDRAETVVSLKAHLDEVMEKYKSRLPAAGIIIAENGQKSNKEARDYAASEAMKQYYTAIAFVLKKGGLTRIAGNLFLKFSKPTYPTRLFSNEENAVEWLEPYK